jgi:endonuclease/exonuclease/phosphatase family metal-dependent hydrolase
MSTAGLLTALVFLTTCTAGLAQTVKPKMLAINEQEMHAPKGPSDILRVASLNLAHGRGDALNQLLVSKQGIVSNLDKVALFLEREDIDVVALQEADTDSAWSGDFDHTRYLADASGYRWWVQGSHARLGIANYGTAIMSALPMAAAASHDFSPSPPTARKGFTVAEILWRTAKGEQQVIDVISLHMDFSRKSVRAQQLAELSDTMHRRNNPVIIMGDFNSEALAGMLIARAAENARHLHTWEDHAGTQATYKSKRLDWIIASGELEFVDYRAAADGLSDHRAVIATVRLSHQKLEQ